MRSSSNTSYPAVRVLRVPSPEKKGKRPFLNNMAGNPVAAWLSQRLETRADSHSMPVGRANVRFEDESYKDIALMKREPEVTSSHFRSSV